jgi:hypothetical protein
VRERVNKIPSTTSISPVYFPYKCQAQYLGYTGSRVRYQLDRKCIIAAAAAAAVIVDADVILDIAFYRKEILFSKKIPLKWFLSFHFKRKLQQKGSRHFFPADEFIEIFNEP